MPHFSIAIDDFRHDGSQGDERDASRHGAVAKSENRIIFIALTHAHQFIPP